MPITVNSINFQYTSTWLVYMWIWVRSWLHKHLQQLIIEINWSPRRRPGPGPVPVPGLTCERLAEAHSAPNYNWDYDYNYDNCCQIRSSATAAAAATSLDSQVSSSSSSSSVCLPLSLCLLLLQLHLPAAIALPTRCKYMKLICTHFVARLRTVYGVQRVLPPSPPPLPPAAAPLGTLGLLRSCCCCCCFLAQTICKRFLISVLNCNKIDAHIGPHCGAVAHQTQLSSTLGDNKESK